MKWISKDKRKCLDTERVCYWEYTLAEDVVEGKHPKLQEFSNFFKMSGNYLAVSLGGHPVEFTGAEADELYNILLSESGGVTIEDED